MELKKIKDIFSFEKGSLQSTKCVEGQYDFITASSEWKTHKSFDYNCEALIVAVAASGSLGRVHYVDGKFISSDLCFILKPKDSKKIPINLEFYFSIFKSLKEDLVKSTATGTAKKSINKTNFGNYIIPYYNIEEQNRLKPVFEKVTVNSVKTNNELIIQRQLISKLKQSILQDAIEGKLTAAWRKENPGFEPASELLNRIKVEKYQLIRCKKIKREKPLPPIVKEEIPFELPIGWVWCRLGEITTYGSSQKIDSHEIKLDTWVLDLEDIEKESSKILQFKTFSDRPSLSTKSVFKKGWVLYSKLRPYLDKVVVVPNDGVCTTEILPLPIYSDLISYFFMYTLKGKHFLTYVNSKVGGMKMPRIGTTDGKMALIPLAPVEEQKVIVEKVEILMQKCQLLEQEIKRSEANAKILMQAVLNEAFEVKEEEVII